MRILVNPSSVVDLVILMIAANCWNGLGIFEPGCSEDSAALKMRTIEISKFRLVIFVRRPSIFDVPAQPPPFHRNSVPAEEVWW